MTGHDEARYIRGVSIHATTVKHTATMEFGLPLSSDQIIESTTTEFQALMERLTVEQVELCKAVRKRGRNNVSARKSRQKSDDYVEELREELSRKVAVGRDLDAVLREKLALRTQMMNEILIPRGLSAQTHTVEEVNGEWRIRSLDE